MPRCKEGTGNMKRCAFCANWYDPTNSAIEPVRGAKDWWEYKTGIQNFCRLRGNIRTRSEGTCSKFQSKL